MSVSSLIASYGSPLIVADSADFDGTNDYMTGGLSGIANGSAGTVAFYLRLDGSDGIMMPIINTDDGGVANISVARTDTNKIAVSVISVSGDTIVSGVSASTYTASATWRRFLISWNNSTGVLRMYSGNTNDLGFGSASAGTTPWGECANNWVVSSLTAANRLNGCLAELYVGPAYFDFSSAIQRNKFHDALIKPLFLGATGSLPSGTAPQFYCHLDDAEAVANFATNRAGRGNFTITGTLATGSTSPSD